MEDRRVDGPEDVTLGWHPALGRCVVSYSPYASRVEWITQRPIPTADEWEDMFGDDPLKQLAGVCARTGEAYRSPAVAVVGLLRLQRL